MIPCSAGAPPADADFDGEFDGRCLSGPVPVQSRFGLRSPRKTSLIRSRFCSCFRVPQRFTAAIAGS
jgi:hypothetical protein